MTCETMVENEVQEFDGTTSSFLENINSYVAPEPSLEGFDSTSSSYLHNVNTYCLDVKLAES